MLTNTLTARRLAAPIIGALLGSLVATAASAQAQRAPAASASVEPEYQQSWADYQAQKARARPAAPANWRGVWRRFAQAGFLGFGDLEPASDVLGPLYKRSTARLTPKYKAAYDEKVAKVKAGVEWDRLSYCLPVGMPRWLTEPWLREFIVTPEATWMIHEQISEVRRIYTDGRSHTEPGKVGPLWEGESVGFWDGDNLVIHTTHLKAGEYQRGQPDFSFRASTVERWQPVDANTIKVDVTVYDPVSLLEPYKGTFTFKKVPDPVAWVNFSSCEQGNNAVKTADGGTTFVLPGEAGYHDPDTFGIPDVALDSLPQ